MAGETQYINREVSDKLYNNLGSRAGRFTSDEFYAKLSDDSFRNKVVSSLNASDSAKSSFMKRLTSIPDTKNNNDQGIQIDTTAKTPQPIAGPDYQTPAQRSKYNTDGITKLAPVDDSPEPAKQALFNDRWMEQHKDDYSGKSAMDSLGSRFFGRSKDFEEEYNTIPEYTEEDLNYMAERQKRIDSQMSKIPEGVIGSFDRRNPDLALMAGRNPLRKIGDEKYVSTFSAPIDATKLPWQSDEDFKRQINDAELQVAQRKIEENARSIRSAEDIKTELSEIESKLPETYTLGRAIGAGATPEGTAAKQQYMQIMLNPEMRKLKKRADELRQQLKMREQIDSIRSIGDDYGKVQTFVKGLKDEKDFESWYTFGLSDMAERNRISDIYEKASKGKKLTNDELETLKLYNNLQDAKNGAPKAYTWGGNFSNTAAFCLEFMLTDVLTGGVGGFAGAINKMLKTGAKGSRALALRKLGASAMYDLSVTPITPMFWNTLSQETLNQYGLSSIYGGNAYVSKDNKSLGTRMRRAYAQAFSERFTESIGNILGQYGLTGRLLKSKWSKDHLKGVLFKIGEKLENTPLGKQIGKINDRLRLSDMPMEVIEEMLNIPIQSALLWEDQFHDANGNFVLADPDFYKEILLDTALLGGMSLAGGGAIVGKQKMFERAKLNNDWKRYANELSTLDYASGIPIENLQNRSAELQNILDGMTGEQFQFSRYNILKEKNEIDAAIELANANGLDYVPKRTDDIEKMGNIYLFVTGNDMSNKDNVSQAYKMLGELPANPGTYDFHIVMENYLQTALKREGLIKGLLVDMENAMGPMAYKKDNGKTVKTATDADGNKWYITDYDEYFNTYAVRDINDPKKNTLKHADDIKSIATESTEEVLAKWMAYERSNVAQAENNPVEAAEDVVSSADEVGINTVEETSNHAGQIEYKEGDRVSFGNSTYKIQRIEGEEVYLETENGMPLNEPVLLKDIRPLTKEENDVVDQAEGNQPGRSEGEIQVGSTVSYEGKPYEVTSINDDGTLELTDENAKVQHNIPKEKLDNHNTQPSNVTPQEEPISSSENGNTQIEPKNVGQVSERISKKWNDAQKQYGFEDRQYVGKTPYNVRYVLTEQSAVTPSHDWHTFKPIDDFIQTASGENANSRAYEQASKRAAVESRASAYNGKAFQDPVFVVDGAVISGNGRTMSGYIAMENGTDKQYIEDLKYAARKFGFTPEQVEQFKNPRIYAEIIDDVELNSDLFDSFNKPTQEGESVIDRAIAFSKKKDNPVIDKIIFEISKYPTLSKLYGNGVSCKLIKDMLVKSGFLNENQVPTYFNTSSNQFTAEGKALIESVLNGCVLDTKHIILLNSDGMGNIRTRIARCAPIIMQNVSLGNELSLSEYINNAIEYINSAKKDGVNIFGLVSTMRTDNNKMFGSVVYDDWSTIIAIKLLESDESFKEFLNSYNKFALDNRDMDPLFGDKFEPKDKYEEAVANINNELNNLGNTEKDAERRKELEAQLEAIAESKISQRGNTDENDGGNIQPGTETSTGTDNAGTEKPAEQPKVETQEESSSTQPSDVRESETSDSGNAEEPVVEEPEPVEKTSEEGTEQPINTETPSVDQEEVPEENVDRELTEDEIRNSGYPDIDVIDSAVDFINGNDTSFAAQIAYQNIKEYVRSKSDNSKPNSGNENTTQLASSANATSAGENKPGGNQTEQVDNGTVPGRGGIPSNQESPSKPSGTRGNQRVQGNVSNGVSGPSGNIQSGRPNSGSGRGNELHDGRGNKTQGTESSKPNNGTGTEAGSTDVSSLEDELTSLINGFGSHPSIESNTVIVQEEPHSSFIRRKFYSLAKKLFGFDSADIRPERNDVLSRKRPKIVPVALSTEGLSQSDIILFGKIIFGAAKTGYAVAKTTSLFSKKDFSRYFISKFGNIIKEKMGYDDAHIISLVDEAWNTKLNIDGERVPLSQHIENMRNSEIRGWFGKTKEERAEEQKARNGVVGKNKYADRNEIKEDLPILQPGQWDDVVFAERQFFDPSHNDYDHVFGKGVLVTNGTGTGKTFTGLGVVKRFLKEGKKNILIVCPANMKPDWMKTARFFDMEISELNDKKDAGKDVSITSYENFRDNNEIMSREFDLVVYDECQNIVMNQQGDETLAYNAHIMVTNKDIDSASERMLSATPDGKRRFELSKQKEELNRQLSKAKRNEVFDIRIKIDQVDSEISDITRKLNALKPSLADKAKESVSKTKVLMLSATPFNTVRNLKIAEGIAFNYPKVIRSDGSENTKAGAKYGSFITEWFSGDSRTNDEIDFGDHLLDELETMQFRELENGFDYSRDFPDVSGKVKAIMFNEAWRFIMSSPLRNYATFLSNPIWTTQLFEVMKVSAIKDRIIQHLDLGRKLILFHDRLHETQMSVDARGKEIPPVGPPFSTVIRVAKADLQATSDVTMAIQTFVSQFAEILRWEKTLDYRPVPDQIIDMFATEADRERYDQEMEKYNQKVAEYTAKVNDIQSKYPELSLDELNDRKLLPKAPKRPKLKAESVCLFNGECTAKEKEDAKDEFNSDNGNKRIICVNTKSGGAGLSLHDTTGKFQRVMIGLALPVSPIGFIQCEGRPFRFGNMSNGIFEYPLLGIDLEAIIFAQSFNVKAETVENLSHGTQGRGLKASIMTQFYENGGNVPLAGQGVGSKEMDRRGNSLKGMAKAIHDFGVAIKKVIAKSDKSVPEPIGYKMSKLAGAMPGDIIMVPYAGRGCVSRYFDSNVTVESYSDNPETMATLAIVASGENLKIAERPFEEVNEIKKGDVVVVGSALRGRVAIDTASKGFKHTNPGGRLVVIMPEGGEFDNAINSLGKEAFVRTVITIGSNMLGNDTPKSRIFVIDRVANPKMREGKIANKIDLSHITSKDELFREIDQIVIPERIIDKEAIKIKKVKNVITELKKNELVSSVTFNENNGDIHVEYKTTKGFKVAKIKFSSLCLSGGYYYQGNGEWIGVGDLKTTNKDSGWVIAYTRIKEYLDMDTDEMRKALRMDDGIKEEKVQAARDLLKSWVKFIRAASGFNDSQINRIKNGLKPEIDLADITDMVTLDILKEKFDTANESEELQELFDKAFAIAVKSKVKLDDSPAGPGAAAEYDPKGHVLRFNKLAWNRADSRRKAAVLLHELIHSVTSYALDAYRYAHDIPEKLENAVDWVDKIYRAIQTGTPANVRLLSGSLSYALENTHEFLANITTQEVEDALRRRPMWVSENNGKRRVSGDMIEGWTEVSAWELVKGAVNEIIDNFDENINNIYKTIASIHALHPELQDKIDNDILRNVTSDEQSLQDTETNRVTTEAVTTLLSDAGVDVKMVSEEEANREADSNTRYHIVESDEEKRELEQALKEGGEEEKWYCAMQVIDGELYPVMSAYDDDGNLRQPSRIGVYERSDEDPDSADENGKYKLRKTKGTKNTKQPGMGDTPAAYNPYFHLSTKVLNDQFSGASTRPNVVIVEVAIPSSERKSGYHAEKAKDSVGILPWHSGPVNSQLTNQREVILSRWRKPLRIVEYSEVADMLVKQFGEDNPQIPFNTLHPKLAKELEKRGVAVNYEWDSRTGKGNPFKKGTQFRTSDGIVYGYTKNGIIYLNAKRLNPNTPIHEYTHLWDGACQQLNPELWRRGKELMKQTSVWNDVLADENYANIRNDEDAIASEAHSRLTGKHGAAMLEEMANEGNTATEKITAKGLIGKLKKWLNSFWKWTKDTFSPWSKEEADKVSLDDFVNMPIGDLVRGKNPNDPRHGRRLRNTENGFYSNALKAVLGIGMEKATPQQWKNMIAKDGGLKAGEDKWLGLSEWLDSSDKKTLTKDEVIDFINNHTISIEEVNYEDKNYPVTGNSTFDELQDEFVLRYTEIGNVSVGLNESLDKAYEDLSAKYGDDFSRAFGINYNEGGLYIKDVESLSKLPKFRNGINETRLFYTTRGLDNKREIALTVPTIEPWNGNDDIHFGDAGEGRAIAWVRFGDANSVKRKSNNGRYDWVLIDGSNFVNKRNIYKPFNGARDYIVDYGSKGFALYINEKFNSVYQSLEEAKRSYETINPKKEIVDSRVLFIDEIQSKRHQEGREKGYIVSQDKAHSDWNSFINKMRSKYTFDSHTQFSDFMTREELEEVDRLQKQLNDAYLYADKIPSAPFEKNWHELAMKRMLRLAAEEGYDYIAWTSGEQQALRYNIGGVVDSIRKLESNDINEQVFSIALNGRGNQYLITNNEGRVIRSLISEFIDNNLSDIFGKDIAIKMLSAKENTTISNEELRIGGEGMRGFYDSILPKFMDKYGKKWGVKTEDMFIPGLEGKGVTAHAVPVTESMRESVMQGQLMFDIRRPMTAVEEDMMKRASDLKEYELTFGERLWEFFGDKNKSVKKFLDIAKGRGVMVDSSTDAYIGLESSISRSTDQIEEEYNKPIYNHLCDAIFALKKKFEELGISTQDTSFNDVGLFAMAMHAKERNRKICVDEIETYVRRKLVTTDAYNSLNSALSEDGTSIREVCTQLYQNSFEDGNFDFGFLSNLDEDIIPLAETMKKAAVRKIKGIAKSDVKENRSGMRNSEADEYLAIFNREECRKEIDELKKWRDASNKFVLDEWLKFGAISREEYNELTSMYENYVPLRGWDIKEELNLDDYLSNAAYNRGSSMVALNKHAFGRESIADNPFTYMKQLAVSSIIRGNRNLARQKMYKLLAENPGKLKDLAYIPKSYQVKTPDGEMEIWFEKPTAEQEDEGYELVATGYNKDYKWHSTYAEQKAKMVEVDFDGEKRFMVFNGKLGISVASAMRIDNDLMRLDDLITRTLQRVTNIHKALLTSANPMFWYRNSWRDLRQALKIERNENGRESRNNLLRHYFVAVGNVFMFEMDHGKKSRYYDLYQQFKIDGGRIGWSRMQSIDDLRNEIESEMKKRSKSGIYLLTERGTIRLVRKFWKAMSTASEVSVRFAEYLNSLDQGKDREAAARDAREITANFNHKGRGSSFLNIYFEFFSPTLTGDARIVNMAKNSKASRIAADCALMVSSRIMLSLISAMMCEGDGDDKENTYDLLSEYRKFAYDIIPIPWGEKDRFLIIPRPHIFRGILNVGDQAAAVIRGKKTIEEASHDWLMNMVSDWSPIDVEAFDMKNLTIGDKLERMLLPTIVRPIIENKQNRDYQGNKIHQDESIFEENTSPEYKKAGSRTGKAFIATSRALNNLAGGTDYRSAEYQIDDDGNIRESGFRGVFDINPSDVQHIIEGYGGGNFTIINNTLKTGESIVDWLRSDDKDFDFDWNVVPITNLIMVQAGKSRSGYKYFFAAREQAKRAEDMLRNAEKAMDMNEIEKIHKANDEVVSLYNSYQKLLKKVGKMEYEGMSDSDRKQLQKTKDELMESFKNDYLSIKNKQEK